jgi:hypothetical protein
MRGEPLGEVSLPSTRLSNHLLQGLQGGRHSPRLRGLNPPRYFPPSPDTAAPFN